MIKDLIRSGLILCFCFAISFICSCNHDMGPQLDVMTWNIWHGGIHGTEAKAYEEDTTNTENVLLVLEQNHSDVLLMQETYCCGMELAQRAGYEYSWRSSSNLSIHSRYPIIDTINFSLPFNAQGAIIEVGDQKLMVINIWLNYLPNTFESSKSSPPD